MKKIPREVYGFLKTEDAGYLVIRVMLCSGKKIEYEVVALL